MPTVEFTSHLAQHVECDSETVHQPTLRLALDEIFQRNPKLRGYILDDQGNVRKHIAIFIEGQLLRDRKHLDVPLEPDGKVFVMQALSGG